VTLVKGSWKVPAVLGTLCATTAEHIASTWVGIDGFSSGTVEQTGTTSVCFEGTLVYFAWYEFYPAAPVTISSVPVSPGDTITASVKFSGGLFTATLKDVTTSKSFTSPATSVAGAAESSAEWITEPPFGSPVGVLELAHFANVVFSGGYATISGKSYTIASSATATGATVYALTMVDFPASSPLKASVSALTVSGAGFTTKWLSAGPYG
jgi:hypothetical protein